jgi:hypothetical protein
VACRRGRSATSSGGAVRADTTPRRRAALAAARLRGERGGGVSRARRRCREREMRAGLVGRESGRRGFRFRAGFARARARVDNNLAAAVGDPLARPRCAAARCAPRCLDCAPPEDFTQFADWLQARAADRAWIPDRIRLAFIAAQTRLARLTLETRHRQALLSRAIASGKCGGDRSDRSVVPWSGCRPLSRCSGVVGQRLPARAAAIRDRESTRLAYAPPSPVASRLTSQTPFLPNRSCSTRRSWAARLRLGQAWLRSGRRAVYTSASTCEPQVATLEL